MRRVAGPRDATLRFVRKTLDLPPRQYTASEIRDMEKRTLDAEKALSAARDAMESIANALRALDEERMRIDQETLPARSRIEEVRLKEQAALLQEQQYAEQLQTVGADIEQIAELIRGGARMSSPTSVFPVTMTRDRLVEPSQVF